MMLRAWLWFVDLTLRRSDACVLTGEELDALMRGAAETAARRTEREMMFLLGVPRMVRKEPRAWLN